MGLSKIVAQPRYRLFALLIVVAAGLASAAEPAAPPAFTIENVVYDDEEKIGGSTTVFAEGKVYDYLAEHPETCVFDPTPGRLILLDAKRRLRTEISTQELGEFCKGLRERALASGTKFVKFAAQPEFAERIDAETNELVLSSEYIDYRAKTTAPKSDAFLKLYQEFTYWQTQLNTVVNPGAPPPGARLKLNDALAKRQLLPADVTMCRHGFLPGMSKSLRAEHHYQWFIGEPERKRIAETEEQLGSFRIVSIEEYLRPAIADAGQ